MTFAPLDPASSMFVLSMIHPRWAPKARIVTYVGSFHGGAWISAREVSAVVGRNFNRCRQLLNELEDQRVILRRLASGTRPAWCEVNPDVGAWREVPWVHDPATIEMRLALHEKHCRATSTALERLVARPIGVTQADLVARLIAARLAPEEGVLRNPIETRDYSVSGVVTRAAIGRATSNGLSRGHRRATRGTDPEVVLTHDQQPASIGSDACGEPASEVVEAARRMVLGRALPDPRGRRWVNGQPLATLKRLLLSHPLEMIEAVLEHAPPDQYVPGMVEWLADNIDLPAPELPHAPVAPRADCAVCDSQRWLVPEDGGPAVRCWACSACDNGAVTVGEDR